MKTTYLVNQEQPDGSVCLAIVSSTEWLDIVRMNKLLPANQRRYFIIDYIQDGNELDRMVMEAPMDMYRKWHREHMASQRNRELGKAYQRLSLDVFVPTEEGPAPWSNIIEADGQIVEETICDQMLLDDLRKKLAAWKPWANDMLDLYLDGKKRMCSSFLAEKYGVSERMVRKYKTQFEDFIKNFISGVPF